MVISPIHDGEEETLDGNEMRSYQVKTSRLPVRQTGRGVSLSYFKSIMVFDSVNVAPVTPLAERR